MIRSNLFKTALPIADALCHAGSSLSVKPNTVMTELVQLSSLPYDVPLETDEQIDLYPQLLENATTGNDADLTEHSKAQDAIVADLAKVVQAHISFAKSIVKPQVMACGDSLKNYLENFAPKSALTDFNIEILDIPVILKDESFIESLSSYKGKDSLTPDLKFRLGEKSQEDLLQLALVGHERTDQQIMEWLSTLSPDFLGNVWASLFTTLDAKDLLSFNGIAAMSAFDKIHYDLAVYLLSRKLYDNVEETTDNSSLSAYKNTATQYRDYAGAALVEDLRKILMLTTTNMLILETNQIRKTVRVNGSVYRPWLEAGGSPEVILGAFISGRSGFSRTIIDERKEDYLKQWTSYNTFQTIRENENRFKYFKEYLANTFNDQLRDLSADEEEFVSKNPGYHTTVQQLATAELDSLRPTDMANCYDVALRIVAKCRFYYTSAYCILSDINEAGKVNPDVDVREAALLAIINYIADYLADQIIVVR